MNRSLRPIHRLSGPQPPSPTTEHALSEALALRNASALEGETVEILQTLSHLFPGTPPLGWAAAGVLLQAPADGHTCLSSDAIAQRFIRQDATPPDEDAADEIPDASAIHASLLQNGRFCAPWRAADAVHPPDAPFVHAFGRFYLHRAAVTEHGISQALQTRIALTRPINASLNALTAPLVSRMHAAQLQAVHTALQEAFMLLTGGPGTGKTWTVRAILAVEYIAALQQGRPLPRVALAAPTGKASARMLESLHAGLDAFVDEIGKDIAGGNDEHTETLRAALQKLDAQTLHRLLQVNTRRQEAHFVHADLVIVDEVSMVDAPMMHRLLAALGTHTRLILIGDPHQLASVEAGSVLSDFVALAAKVPQLQKHVVHLTESRRFSETSLIGQLARATLDNDLNVAGWNQALRAADGQGALPAATLNDLADGYIPLMRAAQAAILPAHEAEAQRDQRAQQALDALAQFQILCAHHRGPRSVTAINEQVTRALIRRNEMRDGGAGGLSVGMPIMVLENDYTLQRYNGDIGVVIAPNLVAFNKETGGIQYVPVSRLPEHTLAFGITVHKSQGSEWNDVRFVLPAQPSRILTRELVYTAISRARERIQIVGSKATLGRAIAHKADRATGLIDVISAQL